MCGYDGVGVFGSGCGMTRCNDEGVLALHCRKGNIVLQCDELWSCGKAECGGVEAVWPRSGSVSHREARGAKSNDCL